jgi:hypothetical protein
VAERTTLKCDVPSRLVGDRTMAETFRAALRARELARQPRILNGAWTERVELAINEVEANDILGAQLGLLLDLSFYIVLTARKYGFQYHLITLYSKPHVLMSLFYGAYEI